MERRVGIHDVARAAGVSTTTVSHALSGRGKVSQRTRERVQVIARELGYTPNRVATALRRQRTDIIGLVSDEIGSSPFAGAMVLGAEHAANAVGMSLMLVDTNRDSAVERRQIEALRVQQIDALIYATMSHRRVTVPEAAAGMTVVLANAEDVAGAAASVAPDEAAAGAAATRQLIDAGHRRIAHLTIDRREPSVVGRDAGYRSVLRAAGGRVHTVAEPTPVADATAGRRALRRALDADPEVTAVFCFNDQMAMGAYQTAMDVGLRVPTGLSVIGVDNLELIADHLRPGLTTLALPHYEMGRWAVEEAVRRIEGETPTVGHQTIECRLVPRESIARPR